MSDLFALLYEKGHGVPGVDGPPLRHLELTVRAALVAGRGDPIAGNRNNITTHSLHVQYRKHKLQILARKNESGVSPVSKRYMRAGIGNERLLVCLSEYLPLRIVYRISSMSMIAVLFSLRSSGFVSRRDHESPFSFQMSFRPNLFSAAAR